MHEYATCLKNCVTDGNFVCPGDEQHDLADLYNHIITMTHCNRICYTA